MLFGLAVPGPRKIRFEPRRLVELSNTEIRNALVELTREVPGARATVVRASGTWCKTGYPPAMFLALVPKASLSDEALPDSFRSLESLGWTRFGEASWSKSVEIADDGALLTVHELDGFEAGSSYSKSYYGEIPRGMVAVASGGGLDCRSGQFVSSPCRGYAGEPGLAVRRAAATGPTAVGIAQVASAEDLRRRRGRG